MRAGAHNPDLGVRFPSSLFVSRFLNERHMAKTKTKKRTLKPAADRLVVKRIEAEVKDKSEGGIVLPESAVKKEKTQYATVEAAGEWASTAEVGSTVLIYKHVGVDVELDGQTLTVIEGKDVLATIA